MWAYRSCTNSRKVRALAWGDLDLAAGLFKVQRSADDRGQIGPPKTRAGRCTLELPLGLVTILKAWRLAAPSKEPDDLVFAAAGGWSIGKSNLVRRCWHRLADALEIEAGFHSLRHYYTSSLIARGASP